MRSPRKTPPTPRVSAIVWRTPKRLGYVEVGERRGVPADVDRVDHEVGAGQRLAAVGGRAYDGLAAVVAQRDVRELLGQGEPLGVDVVHHQLEAREVVEGEQVAQQLTGELGGAGPHEDDGRHPRQHVSRPRNEQGRSSNLLECGLFGDVTCRLTTVTDVLVVGDANPDLILSGDVIPRFGQVEQLLDGADLVIGGSGGILAHGAGAAGPVDTTRGRHRLGHARRPDATAARRRPGSTPRRCFVSRTSRPASRSCSRARTIARCSPTSGAIPLLSRADVQTALDRAVARRSPAPARGVVLPARRARRPSSSACWRTRGPAG